MNTFFRELKAHRRPLIAWCIGMVLMVVSGMGKFAGATASGQSMNDILAQLPRAVKEIFGIGPFDLSKASGFYGMLFLYLAIMAAIHAAMLGAGIIAEEEVDKTAEFLFAKPVSRSRVITSKLSAALFNIFILNIVTLVSSILMVNYVGKGEDVTSDIIKLMSAMFILQLIFMFIGTGIAAISKNPKSAAALATGILLITFILSKAIDLSGRLDVFKYLTPFKYYEAQNLLYGGRFNLVFVTLSGVIIAVLFVSTYVFYKKRDLII